MAPSDLEAKRRLQSELEQALDGHPSSADLLELVVRCGWQPRPVPDPNSDFLEGVLANGTRVPVEIRHAVATRVG